MRKIDTELHSDLTSYLSWSIAVQTVESLVAVAEDMNQNLSTDG